MPPQTGPSSNAPPRPTHPPTHPPTSVPRAPAVHALLLGWGYQTFAWQRAAVGWAIYTVTGIVGA
jgi:hypothetical protein